MVGADEPLSSNPRDANWCQWYPQEAAKEIERLTRELDLVKNNMPAGVLAECVLRARDWNNGRVTMAVEEWNAHQADNERLRADLDNERSAMRNVQECAESYRREVEQLKEMNAHLSRGNMALSAVEHKLTAEVERLRAALERIAGHDLDDIQQMEIAREALRPPDETAAVKPPKCKHPKVLIDDVLAKTCPDCGELV